MRPLRIVPDEPLSFEFDVDARLEAAKGVLVKGMFFARLVEMLGPEWDGVQKTLAGPPRFGTYIPFSDYPHDDYLRLVLVAMKRNHPTLPPAEGARRIGRDDFATFGKSRFGAVMMRLAGDARSGLAHMPTAWNSLVKGGRMSGEDIPGGYRLRMDDFRGWTDCYLPGQLEGVVQHYGRRAFIDAAFPDERTSVFDVRID